MTVTCATILTPDASAAGPFATPTNARGMARRANPSDALMSLYKRVACFQMGNRGQPGLHSYAGSPSGGSVMR